MNYPKSKSGYWKVDLSAPFPHDEFTYRPGTGITVNKSVLDAMIAAGVVASATPA